MQYVNVCVLLFALVSFVTCFKGKHVCRDVEVVKDFQTARYLGRWYQWAYIPKTFGFGKPNANAKEKSGPCFTTTYTANTGLVFSMVNRWYNEKKGIYRTMKYTAWLIDYSGEAKIIISWPFLSRKANYWVLATDYENYALIYGCNKIENKTFVNSWILSREPIMNPNVLTQVYKDIAKNNLNPSEYRTHHGDNCQYE